MCASAASVAWLPSKVPRLSAPECLPAELQELARQLHAVHVQREELLANGSEPSSPPRRRQSPSSAKRRASHLAPLSPSRSPSRSAPVLPAWPASDRLLCECLDEFDSSLALQRHRVTDCRLRPVRCPRAGCEQVFPAEQRAQHDASQCPALQRTRQLLAQHADAHAPTPCPQCAAAVPFRQLSTHQLVDCPRREVSCRFAALGCPARFAAADAAAHEAQQCVVARHRAQILAHAASVNATTTCDWCGGTVLQRKLLDHQEDTCPERERPCPHAPACPEWVPVGRVDEHLRSQCVVTRERDAMVARAREQNAPVRCLQCGDAVPRRHLGGHLRAECPSRVVACKNAAHGCNARLRFRDRHLHEDFLALARRERSMLCFPVGGHAYVAVTDESWAEAERQPVDLPPPWTAEYFVWLEDAREEIVELHLQSLEHVETIAMQSRERERCQQQSAACKKQLKQLKKLRRDKRSAAEIAASAKDLAEAFDAAEQGAVAATQAIALAKGWLQILVLEAARILLQPENDSDRDDIRELVASQAREELERRVLLQELGDDEQQQLADLERWARALERQAASPADRQQRVAEQNRLLAKRAEWAELKAALRDDDPDHERLLRRYDRELAKVDAKLALVSDATPRELLERRGRHVIASSSRYAISLVGGRDGGVTFYRPATAKGPREVPLGVALARNRWHHVVLSASQQGELTLVLDGSVAARRRGLFRLPLTRLGAPSESFQGYVQEVRYWRSCLPLESVRRQATAVLDVARHSDLLAYWTFEEAHGELVDDLALRLPRAACVHTTWVLYNTAAVRRRFGAPPTPSYRDRTACIVNQRLRLLAQHARDRATERVACSQRCGAAVVLRDLDAHLRLECPKRLVVCREVACDALHRADDAAGHRATACRPAGLRDELVRRRLERLEAVECLLLCGLPVTRGALERHVQRACPNRLISCPRADCGETIVAHSVREHLRADCKSPSLLRERRRVENARQRRRRRQRQRDDARSQPDQRATDPTV
ncbi:hypothetical protein P43SY_004127 [Pythium insidiosum]|uniref:TRAF-type domain-containing protein n=1 Tax=Pythium insidiosum TaxID=114742 RepID=A0AAD5LEW4_PYTIN|nr:hypothetical protein P43SY_004127 [Pythium insidiosum]